MQGSRLKKRDGSGAAGAAGVAGQVGVAGVAAVVVVQRGDEAVGV
jgi:hypothetical protein